MLASSHEPARSLIALSNSLKESVFLFSCMKILPWIAQLFLIILSGFISLLIWSYNYPEIIDWLKTAFQETYDAGHLERHFTSRLFFASRIIIPFMFLLLFTGFLVLLRHKNPVVSFTKEFYSFLANEIKRLVGYYRQLPTPTKVTLILIMAANLIYRLAFLYKQPPEADEIFSYVYFERFALWFPALYYPEPNNHIFFTLLSTLLGHLIHDPILALRIPSILFLILTLFSLFFLIRRSTSNDFISLLSVALTAFSLPCTYYSLAGRGYMTITFFSIICALVVWEIIFKNPDEKFYYVLLVCFAVPGLYTIPVFLFPLSGIFLFGIACAAYTKNTTLAKKLIITFIATGILAFLLYLPVMLFNGWEALFNNRWVRSRPYGTYRNIFLPASLESADYIFGVNKKGYVLATISFLLSCFLLWNDRTPLLVKYYLMLVGAMVLAAILLMTGLSVFPPYRTWTYLIPFAWSLCIIALFYTLQRSVLKKLTYIITGCFSGFFILINVQNYVTESPETRSYTVLKKKIDLLTQIQPHRIFFEKHDTMELYLRYELLTSGIPAKFYTGSPEGHYDLVILQTNRHKDSSQTLNGYQLLFQSDTESVYAPATAPPIKTD